MPYLEGVGVLLVVDLEHGKNIHGTECANDVAHPVVGIQVLGCFLLFQPREKWIRLLWRRRW